MSDFFKDFSPSSAPEKARAKEGGECECKELPYSPPKGPTPHMQQSPGLHGTNHGNAGTQGKH